MSPWIAPQAAIAAETPQIDTAVESMTENSSSTFSFRASQKQKYQTAETTSSACAIPRAPACTISRKRMLEPRMTRPVLMKYSVRTASRSQPGSADDVADEQADDEREDDVLEPPVAQRGVARDHLGDPGERVHHREPDRVPDRVPAEQGDPDEGHEEVGEPDHRGRPEVLRGEDAAEERAGVRQALAELGALLLQRAVLRRLGGVRQAARSLADRRPFPGLRGSPERRRGRCELLLAARRRLDRERVQGGLLRHDRARDGGVGRPLEPGELRPDAGEHERDDCQPEPRGDPVLALHEGRPAGRGRLGSRWSGVGDGGPLESGGCARRGHAKKHPLWRRNGQSKCPLSWMPSPVEVARLGHPP